MIKPWIIVLLVPMISADSELTEVHGFFLGFIEGMQRSTDQPGDCLTKLPNVSEAYTSFEQGIASRNLGNLLVSVRDLVNEVSLFEKVCQLKPLLDRVFDIFTVDGIQQLGVILVANLTFFVNSLQLLQLALANWVTYDIGFNLGQLISKTTNYYL